MKPVVAISMGDPVGVGPEVVLKALADKRVLRACRPVVVGDAGLLDHLAGSLELEAPPAGVVRASSALSPSRLKPGRPTKATASAMVGYIEGAVAMAMNGQADAVVTAPISKEAAKKAGFAFPGHTEFLAHLTGAKDFRMMLGGADLKVVLATIHVPLKKVPRLVTGETVFKTIEIAHASFKRDFRIERPRIAVAGLNPHAGEGGLFGDEETRHITPAVKKARRRRMLVTGPLPADTVFYRAAVNKEFDCVVCMYHDQGLGPLKLIHFEDGINATLGLPIIRTSPDHGTAYDIAWTGRANHQSMVNAITVAAAMARARARS